MAVVAAAQRDPNGRDWEPEIQKYLTDPAAKEIQDAVESLVSERVHVVTPVTLISAHASVVEKNNVTIVACVDSSTLKLVDNGGIEVPLPATNAPRGTATVEVSNFGNDGDWLVYNIGAGKESLPC